MNIKPRPNHKIYLEILRRMTPEQRLLKAFELTEFSRQLFRQGLRNLHPVNLTGGISPRAGNSQVTRDAAGYVSFFIAAILSPISDFHRFDPSRTVSQKSMPGLYEVSAITLTGSIDLSILSNITRKSNTSPRR